MRFQSQLNRNPNKKYPKNLTAQTKPFNSKMASFIYIIAGIGTLCMGTTILNTILPEQLNLQNNMENISSTPYVTQIPSNNLDYDNSDDLFQEEAELVMESSPISISQNLIFPMKTFVQTDFFGARINPITGRPEHHNGIDIDGGWKSPIYAAADGTVIKTNTKKSSLGNWIMLSHQHNGQTLYTVYGHLHDINVKTGDAVFAMQEIATQGGDPERDENPGQSTGSHLHFVRP